MKAVSLRAALVTLLVVVVAGCGLTLGGAPVLLAPPNGATLGCAVTGASYVFTWGAVPNARTYVLHIETNTAPYVIVYNATVSAPATTLGVPDTDLACGATYRWRVGATFTESNPTPTWSGYWTFTIVPGP